MKHTSHHLWYGGFMLLLAFSLPLMAGGNEAPSFPDILGYRTLKCDFHSHTVFSDGDVWPTLRVREARLTGLDVLAITDHLESQSKQEYVKGDRNTSYLLARDAAAELGMVLIHGGEITRNMPPGHLNALFVEDNNVLAPPRWQDAVTEVKKQGGLLIWNHPGWENQQPDRIARWYPQHDSLLQSGLLAGIEIVNGYEYYPEAHQWCLDKKLALFGNSDVHSTIFEEQYVGGLSHRPMTLVFARDRSIKAIREAILDRRTCVYANETLYGEERFLRALFDSSVVFGERTAQIKKRSRFYTGITNRSNITFALQLEKLDPEIQFDYDLVIRPGDLNRLTVRARKSMQKPMQSVTANYKVTNALVAPGRPLVVPVVFKLEFQP